MTIFDNTRFGARIRAHSKSQLTLIMMCAGALLIVNFLNFGTIYFTLQRDGASLRIAESYLTGICHRMPSRSFWIAEVPLGLCSRCTGIYLIALISILIVPLTDFTSRKYAPALSAVLMLPLLFDGIVEHYALYAGDNTIRFVTGAMFGFALVTLLLHLWQHLIHPTHHQGGRNVNLQ